MSGNVSGPVRLHIEQVGPPDGQALVLLHGLGNTGESWFFQRDVLGEAGYRVLLVDARGHGQSEKPHTRFSIQAMAGDVVHALDGLGIETAHVCGLSLGGALALTLAMDYPGRVGRLVVVNSAMRFIPRDLSRLLYFGMRVILMQFISFRQQARLVANRVFPNPEHAHLRDYLYQILIANDPIAYRRVALALARFDARGQVGRIQAPTLVIAGDKDTTVPMRDKRALAAAIPGARLEVVAGSGHGTPVDSPEAFTSLLLDFLGKS